LYRLEEHIENIDPANTGLPTLCSKSDESHSAEEGLARVQGSLKELWQAAARHHGLSFFFSYT